MSVGWACGMVWVWRYCFDILSGGLRVLVLTTPRSFYAMLWWRVFYMFDLLNIDLLW